MFEQYVEKMKELMELGQQILEADEENEDILEEIDCMNLHLKVGLKILGVGVDEE
jgi:hypothetical protein